MPITYVPVSVPDAATYSVKVRDNGLLHTLPDFTSSCTISLPTPFAGASYEFVGKAVAADAQSWIFTTGSDTYYFVGGLGHLDADSGTGADEVVPVFPDGNSNSKCTVAVPAAGTHIRFACHDGTHWTINGIVIGATAPAFADQ